MRLILNERRVIEECLENGVVDKKKPSATISLLAKYYNLLGKNEDQMICIIDTFMQDNYENYNSVTWRDSLEGIIKSTMKFNKELIEVNEVHIYEAEAEFIKSLENEKFEKLAFTYLVYAKIFNQINPLNNNWVGGKHRNEVFKDANVTDTGLKQLYTLHDLIHGDILYATNSIDNSSLNVGNYISTQGETALVVKDFRQLGLQWLKYIECKAIKECTECGVLYRKKTNSQKYCNECSKKMKNKAINDSRKKKKINA